MLIPLTLHRIPELVYFPLRFKHLRQISAPMVEAMPSRREITGDVRAQVGRCGGGVAIVVGVALDSVYQLLHRTRLVARETNTPGQIVNLCFLVITPV